MAISSKVKALLKLRGKENGDLARYLGISTQALSNKFYRDSFSASDLIRIVAFLDCNLAFVIDEEQKIVLDEADIKTDRQV